MQIISSERPLIFAYPKLRYLYQILKKFTWHSRCQFIYHRCIIYLNIIKSLLYLLKAANLLISYMHLSWCLSTHTTAFVFILFE